MRRVCLPILLVWIAVSAAACTARQFNLPPSSQVIYDANEAAILLGTIQHVAIELNNTTQCIGNDCHALLSERNTRVVVSIVTPTLRVMDAIPNGWPTVMSTALDQILTQLDRDGRSTLSPYMNAARAAIPYVTRSQP